MAGGVGLLIIIMATFCKCWRGNREKRLRDRWDNPGAYDAWWGPNRASQRHVSVSSVFFWVREEAELSGLWFPRSCLLCLRLGRVSQQPGSRPSLNAVEANAPYSDKKSRVMDNHVQESLMIDEVWMGHSCLYSHSCLV